MIDPCPDEMRRLGYAAVDRIVAFLTDLPATRVATPPVPRELRELVAEPLPRAGLGVDDGLRRFFEELLPRATLVNHPRFFAWVPGPGSYAGALGAFCAAATNTFVGTWLGGSVMAQLELQTLDWLREALGLPPGFDGVLTSGGSIANLSALAAARERHAADPTRMNVYTSVETHHSMRKAARLLGFRPAQCVEIPVDGHQRLDPSALRARILVDAERGLGPGFVCATAGTTTSGAIDPIEEIADLCAAHGAWLHVDGAYGAAVALLPEHAALRAALARADSITLDPHKWLYCPFECGALLVRDVGALHAAFAGDADYMQDVPKQEVNFFARGPELSRGNRALGLWLLLRAVGVDAIADRIREDCRLATLAHDLVASIPGVQIVTPPSLSIFTFTVDRVAAEGASAGHRIVDRLIEGGTTVLSSSRIGGEFVLRFCVVNHRTTEADVRSAVDALATAITSS